MTGGTLAPGDDAADARWFTPDELVRLPLTTGLLDALTVWDVLPDSMILIRRHPAWNVLPAP